MEIYRQQFYNNPTVDPKSRKKVRIGSSKYNALTEKYGNVKITSPVTGKKITVGKINYKNLFC